MARVFLGKLLLHWCRHCNLPVLGKKCGKCGIKTEKVDITPPGDIRPAFGFDLELISKIVERDFGDTFLIPNNKLVVLNKAPYDDRMDEIICDGKVVGAIRYEPLKLDWTFLPRLSGARRMNTGKRQVIVDSGAVEAVLKTANVLGPGVIDADPAISAGDEVIVISKEGRVIATGRARLSGSEMLRRTRGLAVKTRWSGWEEERILPGGQTWSDAVEANKHIIDSYEGEALMFIKNVVQNTDRPVTVSYSGGKDSLATLLLVKKVVDKFDVLFADTGLEFEESRLNVHSTAEKYGLKLVQIFAGDAFWGNVEHFGPPSVEARWCCKVIKLGKIALLIEQNYTQGCLTFIGQRKYESETRALSERIWKNPWVGNQVSASPIQNWTALHVWLYIFREKGVYNPLYEKGFDRIGCWLCPSSSLADFQRIKDINPELWQKWDIYLESYARKMGFPDEWKKYGLWRWKRHPPAQQKLMEELGVKLNIAHKEPGAIEFKMVSGYSPCSGGGTSAEASLGMPLDLDRVENMMRAVGKSKIAEGVLYIPMGSHSLTIYASGTIVVRSTDGNTAADLMEKARKSVLRALKCSRCGVCISKCTEKAIRIKEEVEITDSCVRCGKCIENCPAVKYG